MSSNFCQRCGRIAVSVLALYAACGPAAGVAANAHRITVSSVSAEYRESPHVPERAGGHIQAAVAAARAGSNIIAVGSVALPPLGVAGNATSA